MEMTFYASLLPSPTIGDGLQDLHDFIGPEHITKVISGRFGPNMGIQPPHFTVAQGLITKYQPTELHRRIKMIAGCFEPGLELSTFPEVIHPRNELILQPYDRTMELLLLLNSILVSSFSLTKKPDQKESVPHLSLAFLDKRLDSEDLNRELVEREINFGVMALFVAVYKGNASLVHTRYYLRS